MGGPVDRLELLLELPTGVVPANANDSRALRLRDGEEREIPLTFQCTQWGVRAIGDLEVRARDPFRLVVWEESDSLLETS